MTYRALFEEGDTPTAGLEPTSRSLCLALKEKYAKLR